MDIISRADEILLLAILRLKDDACGVTIVKCDPSYPLGQYSNYSKLLFNAS
jgi:hypothetical protein